MAGPTIYFTDKKAATRGTFIILIVLFVSFLYKRALINLKNNQIEWKYTLGKYEKIGGKNVFSFKTDKGEIHLESNKFNNDISLKNSPLFIRYCNNNPNINVLITDTIPESNIEYGKSWDSLNKDMYKVEKR